MTEETELPGVASELPSFLAPLARGLLSAGVPPWFVQDRGWPEMAEAMEEVTAAR